MFLGWVALVLVQAPHWPAKHDRINPNHESGLVPILRPALRRQNRFVNVSAVEAPFRHRLGNSWIEVVQLSWIVAALIRHDTLHVECPGSAARRPGKGVGTNEPTAGRTARRKRRATLPVIRWTREPGRANRHTTGIMCE